MNLPLTTSEEKCSRQQIAAYIDGDLKPQEELCLERHIASCRECLSELNLQKRMFSALDSALNETAEIELPENFAKVVAARAETNVSGLRSKSERFRALFFCSVLFLIVAVGLGVKSIMYSFEQFSERLMAVAGFIGHLAYDLIIGLTVILRSLGKQPVFDSGLIFLFLTVIFILSAKTLVRRLDSSNR